MRCVLSVLGKDHSGIVAAISTALADNNANIVDISQTILGDVFSMTMIVDLDESSHGFNEVQGALEKAGKEVGMQVELQRKEVFDLMYSV